MSADASLQIVECASSPVTVWDCRGGNYLSRFQCDIAVLRFAVRADCLKNAVIDADNIARDTDVIDILFHKNTPNLSWACHNEQVQKFH